MSRILMALALLGILIGCVPHPGFHQVVNTQDGAFMITRVSTEQTSFQEYTHQIRLAKLNDAGEPVGDTRTVNEKGNAHKMLSDGEGGVIIAFGDARGASHADWDSGLPYANELYIQRFDETGHPLWEAEGVRLRGDAGYPFLDLTIVADGAGGVIVIWGEGTQAIYAQRVTASGQILWDTGGVPVVATGEAAYAIRGVADGAGGAFVVWRDAYTLYAQHLNAQGESLWRENGLQLTPIDSSSKASVAADGSGGLVVVWEKHIPPGVTQKGPHVQRFAADDQPCWGQAVPLPGDAYWRSSPPGGVTPDGQGNLLVAWGIGGVHIQKLDLDGHKLWNDVAIFSIERIEDASYSITDIDTLPDDAGGAFIVWRVGESPMKGGQIYVQHLAADGNPQWSENSILVYPQAAAYQGYPQILRDQQGGIVVFALLGQTLNQAEVRAQKIDRDGHLLWSETGVPVRFE